ncbi:serine/threonine-protein phosphatase 1 regulatory subunit 10-like [Anopheles nili]|uniref:serine/threonine-protein phosphatase 1 regulatory subunit 10-like n=1 Tax=Anopheles nili TaxID=185578 RepID=UPI00237BF3AE|nr:serine/threonine-protein phosphatase 1 regulatory subunit 10-like [Anopheles nili]
MELQNQIYLLVAVFGGISALLLVLTVMLAVYVKKMRTLLEDFRLGHPTDDDPYQREGSGDGPRRDRKRPNHAGYPMEVFPTPGGMSGPPKSDLTKTRNDYMHNVRNNIHGGRSGGPYRHDADGGGMGYGGGGGKRVPEKPMKPGQGPAGPRSQGSAPDSALELEVANIFDMDELDEEDLSDCGSGPSTGHMVDRVEDAGVVGHGRGKPRPVNGAQYEREQPGRGNRFQNPHAMKSKNGPGDGRGFAGDEMKRGGGHGGNVYGNGGKSNQGFFDDRNRMY